MRLNLVLLVLVSLFACRQGGDVTPEQPKSADDAHFVDKDAVKGLLSSIAGRVTTKAGSSCFANIESVESVLDSVGNPVYYVINYEPSGFVIMAADNRVSPILAYSAVNSFDLARARSLGGIGEWLSGTTAYVNDVRRIDTASYDSLAWSSARIAQIVSRGAAAETGIAYGVHRPTISDTMIPNESLTECSKCELQEIILPLTTQWDQANGFNMAAPWIDCGGHMNQAPVGCVAVAVGQVMKYYQHPARYNWSLMPDLQATPATAQFLRDIGDRFGMVYGCGSSSAYTTDAPYVLKTHFGYRSANVSNYNLITIQNEIMNYHRPVIMRGQNSSDEGHSWVIMGCQRLADCDEHYSANEGVYNLYMNWGWGGSSAWCNIGTTFNGFDIGCKIVYGIVP